ncbi:MAG: flavodoxin [Gammaproteobacteria bacterium CG22_combo_CG10-13_8_21_14_all_40_8]|nr:MAG: flavodoxin [Gammaproteobacteria bacterium CG22_combo_CG10-13_8_21_14_all_40_8]
MKPISLFVGTVFGQAEQVAHKVSDYLKQHDFEVYLFNPGSVEDIKNAEIILICTSTTGSGDIPTDLEDVYYEMKQVFPLLSEIQYGIITLGDSSYGDTYCGSGVKFDELLTELGAKKILEPLKIDACETAHPEQSALDWLPTFIDHVQ